MPQLAEMARDTNYRLAECGPRLLAEAGDEGWAAVYSLLGGEEPAAAVLGADWIRTDTRPQIGPADAGPSK